MSERPICPDCDSRDISITPVPGLWIQYWCNSCDKFWWTRSNVVDSGRGDGESEPTKAPPPPPNNV